MADAFIVDILCDLFVVWKVCKLLSYTIYVLPGIGQNVCIADPIFTIQTGDQRSLKDPGCSVTETVSVGPNLQPKGFCERVSVIRKLGNLVGPIIDLWPCDTEHLGLIPLWDKKKKPTGHHATVWAQHLLVMHLHIAHTHWASDSKACITDLEQCPISSHGVSWVSWFHLSLGVENNLHMCWLFCDLNFCGEAWKILCYPSVKLLELVTFHHINALVLFDPYQFHKHLKLFYLILEFSC